MTNDQEQLLLTVAHVLRGQLSDLTHQTRSDRSDLEALNRALAPFDAALTQRMM